MVVIVTAAVCLVGTAWAVPSLNDVIEFLERNHLYSEGVSSSDVEGIYNDIDSELIPSGGWLTFGAVQEFLQRRENPAVKKLAIDILLFMYDMHPTALQRSLPRCMCKCECGLYEYCTFERCPQFLRQ